MLDVNDELPAFSQSPYEFSVNEGSDIGLPVGTIRAIDPDHNNLIVYNISAAIYFTIEGSTVQLTTVNGKIFTFLSEMAVVLLNPIHYYLNNHVVLYVELSSPFFSAI